MKAVPGSVEGPPAPDLRLIPEPWSHSPSRWGERALISVIAAVAFLIAVYLGLYQWGLVDGVWDPVFGAGTPTVLDSEVSHRLYAWVGIPDAILGALAYLGDILFVLAGSTRRWQFRPWLVLLFGVNVIPLGVVSAILVALQGTVVGAWCFLCLVTAAISLVLAVLGFDEVWSTVRYLARVWRRSRSVALVWGTLWGRASGTAHKVAMEMVEREPHVGARD